MNVHYIEDLKTLQSIIGVSNKTVDLTHSAKLPTRPKPSVAKPNLLDIWKPVTSQSKRRFFLRHTCLPPTPPFSTTHFTLSYLLSLAGSLISFFFFFFFSFSLIHSSLSLSHPLSPVPPQHHFHHHFSGKITEKSLRTYKQLHIFFEVKVSNLFGGFYTFA